jgi:uncharacterized protein YcbX
MVGDRTWAIFDSFKGAPRRLTAREAPRLLAWHAAIEAPGDDPTDPPDGPLVTAPGGERFAAADPALAAALSDDLGRRVHVVRHPGGQQDLPRSVLVTCERTLSSVGHALGTELDLRRFRTNLHLDLDAEPYDEHGWEGLDLLVGPAAIKLLHPCKRCVIPTRDPDTQTKMPELLRWLTLNREGEFGINGRVAADAVIELDAPSTVRRSGR